MISRKKTYPSVTKYLHRCAVFALICAASWSLSAYSFPVAHPFDRQFVGTWKAIHDGKTIIVLQLRSTNAGLSGTIRLAGFQLDLAEVRHGGAEFCDFDGEIRGSLVFTILVSEKVM